MESIAVASLCWRVIAASALCFLLIINSALVVAFKPQTSRIPSRAKTNMLAPDVVPERLSEAARARIKDAFGKLPLRFEENRGQADEKVKFLSRGPGYSLFLTNTEAVMKLTKTEASQQTTRRMLAASDFDSEMVRAMLPLSQKQQASLTRPDLQSKEPDSQSAVLRMKLANANPAPRVTGRGELTETTSYYIGSNPKNWASRARSFEKVEYKDVYPGIDLIYYGNQGQLEYDFNVAPGADHRAITLTLRGADEIRIDEQGALVIQVGDDEIRQHRPVIYQEFLGVRKPVTGRYLLKGNSRVGFEVDDYNPTMALVIDPVVSAGTYLGGSGTDSMFGMAADAAGNVYTAGFTNSLDFPTANASQPGFAGGPTDIVVSKLSPDLSQLLYSTYIGGSGDDRAMGLDVDQGGNAYVTGFTSSPNFPTPNAMQANFAGIRDIFALKLDGAGSLVYSTYIGRTGDDRGQALAVDSSGNVSIVGLTNSTAFPMVNAFQATYGGNPADVFVLKLNAAGSALLYSSYLGGSASAQPVFGELVNDIHVDSAGNIYLTGFTESSNFPTKSAVQTSFGGGTRDAFLAKFDPSKSGADSLVYSTYLGGSNRDESNAVTVDSSGNAYVTGFTFSTNFPTLSAEQGALAGGADMFVSKVNADGRAFGYSTYLGGTNNEQGTDIEVDEQGNAFIAGGSTSSNFPKAVPLGDTGGIGTLPPSDCGFGFVLGEIIVEDDGSISVEVSSSNTGLTDTNVNALDVSEDGLTIYLAADSGVFKSTDGGLNWVRVYQTDQGVTATSILIGENPDEVFVGLGRSGTAAFASADEIRAAQDSGYVLGSTNGGGRFADLGLNLPLGLSVDNLEEIRAERAEQRSLLAVDSNGNCYTRNRHFSPPTYPKLTIPGNVTHIAVNRSKTTGYAAITGAGANSGVYTLTVGDDGILTVNLTALLNVQGIGALGTGDEPGDVVAARQIGSNVAEFYTSSNSFQTFAGPTQVPLPPGYDLTRNPLYRIPVGDRVIVANLRGILEVILGGPETRSAKSITLNEINISGLQIKGSRAMFTTRFGESQKVTRLNQSGRQLRTRCIPANGNSFNSRIWSDTSLTHFVHSWNTQGTDLSKFLSFPAATPFQASNRGGLDSLFLRYDFSPRINAVTKSGKKLIVDGDDFDEGARIFVNGKRQKKTSNDAENPVIRLIDKKGGKKIREGDIVQVENPAGTRSNVFRFSGGR